MPSVKEVIARLFPDGTNPHPVGERADWQTFPYWPPDAFAIAATLVERTGLYSRPRYAGGATDDLFTPEATLFAIDVGHRWAQMPGAEPLVELQDLWDVFLDPENGDIFDAKHPLARSWWDAAFKLLLTADEASGGVGFVADPEKWPVADFVLNQYGIDEAERQLRYLPSSICLMVPKGELCVQPKARTAQLGCTLRSLTHHLALLPPAGDVTTQWRFGLAAERQADRPLNLLVVPFPYKIDAQCFVAGGQMQRRVIERVADYESRKARGGGKPEDFWFKAEQAIDKRAHFFHMDQRWLRHGGREVTALDVSLFLTRLVEQSERLGLPVNGIVFPELALDEAKAEKVATFLEEQTNLELFISGISVPSPLPGGLGKNQVYTCIYERGILASWKQSKHHRWKLDKSQIELNRLSNSLSPEKFEGAAAWWEGISLEERTCAFYVFRRGDCLAALVCEDLARVDPVQQAIRSVGPNLVVALLMDGPQWEKRWPGRYATVLADDPGCSVLTVTSLGLMRMPAKAGNKEVREVALWKDSAGGVRELWLEAGSHALLLSLSFRQETNFTLDGRSDEGATIRVALDSVHAVAHPNPIPDWVDRG